VSKPKEELVMETNTGRERIFWYEDPDLSYETDEFIVERDLSGQFFYGDDGWVLVLRRIQPGQLHRHLRCSRSSTRLLGVGEENSQPGSGLGRIQGERP
jgi:hypothetical protein